MSRFNQTVQHYLSEADTELPGLKPDETVTGVTTKDTELPPDTNNTINDANTFTALKYAAKFLLFPKAQEDLSSLLSQQDKDILNKIATTDDTNIKPDAVFNILSKVANP